MTPEQGTSESALPATLAELNLPPTFVVDHCIRTLFYQGAMSPLDLASHWRVQPEVGVEICEMLKAAGLVETDKAQATFERRGRVHLTKAGFGRVETARQRTWYGGPLPVSLRDFERHADLAPASVDSEALRAALSRHYLDASVADAVGQALAGRAVIALGGLAPEEQPAIAACIGDAMRGEMTLPYAIFAGGGLLRVFDPRYHRPIPAKLTPEPSGCGVSGGTAGARRSPERPDASRWTSIARPVVTLAGGLLPGDLTPPYDAEARFYIAPTAFLARGGLIAVLDADAGPDELAELAKLWLLPGLYGTGIILLRSGERIEVPWQAATALFAATSALPATLLRTLPLYEIDASSLAGDALRAFLSAGMHGTPLTGQTCIETVASLLEQLGAANRLAAARVARYLRDRATYEGPSFSLTSSALQQAVSFAGVGRAAGNRKSLRAV